MAHGMTVTEASIRVTRLVLNGGAGSEAVSESQEFVPKTACRTAQALMLDWRADGAYQPIPTANMHDKGISVWYHKAH